MIPRQSHRAISLAAFSALLFAAAVTTSSAHAAHAEPSQAPASAVRTVTVSPVVRYKWLEVDGVKVFYREAGPAGAPVVLLLHGFPTSSHMFRNLIPILATKYRVIAPDLPGFGQTEVPAQRNYQYTFDNLANTLGLFTDKLNLTRYAIYVFDYGAPTGFRLALRNPERITALISQNGNAYTEGLSPAWSPIQAYWREPTEANRNALRGFLKPETTRWQYIEGVRDASLVAPESYLLDQAQLDRPGNAEIQLDLFRDYQSNVALYPKFQQFFRDRRPPTLAIWGKNDPFFIPAGAEAYQRDNPAAEVELLDTGHFALETHHAEIGERILSFLAKVTQ